MIKFRKFYNRSQTLFSCQYWFEGEYSGLFEATEGKIRLCPMFIGRKDKGVDIYYYEENDKQERRLVSYFEKRPNKFRRLLEDYKKDCKKQAYLIETATATVEDIAEIYKLHVKSWPKLRAIECLGEMCKDSCSNVIFRLALMTRRKTAEMEWDSYNNLLRLIDKFLPGSKNFVGVLTIEEILNKSIPSKSELGKRKNEYINYEGNLYTGLATRQFEKLKRIKILNKEKVFWGNKGIIKGVSAMNGKATGKVRVVIENDQMAKVKKGEVLVAPMTTPDHIIAMKKAVAFVTDEGGITCHAAIMAREMGKPCVIGAKIATQVLKDGDLIEVDADNGLVKILK